MIGANGNQYDAWCVKDDLTGYFLLSTMIFSTRDSSIANFLSGHCFSLPSWKHCYRRGYRCVKVRIVEVGKYEEIVRRYTEDNELVDSAPVDGIHVERLDDGTVWIRVGDTRMHFIARKRGVLEWQVDEMGDTV